MPKRRKPLACPNCGDDGSIFTEELVAVEYPVVLEMRGAVVAYEYTGGESETFWDTAEPEQAENGESKLVCRNCDHEFTVADVLPLRDKASAK